MICTATYVAHTIFGDLYRLGATLLALSTLVSPGVVFADEPPSESAQSSAQPGAQTNGDKPWHRGVSDENKQRAIATYQRARTLHQAHEYEQALVAYKAALKDWDNPGIHHNLGLLFLKLSHPLAAYEHFSRALAWGPTALDDGRRAEAEHHITTLLSERLGRVTLHSAQAGVTVSLNGEVLFVGPGSKSRVLVPGKQVINAAKPGHYPVIETLAQLPGQDSAIDVTLVEDRVDSERRWATWLPWAVLGGGLAASVAGGVLQARAGDNVTTADARLKVNCPDDLCAPQTTGLYSDARWQQRLAIGAFTVGGLAVVAGVVGVFVNQPITRRSANDSDARIESTPLIWERGAGWSASVEF